MAYLAGPKPYRATLDDLKPGDLIVIVEYVDGFSLGDIREVYEDLSAEKYETLYIEAAHGKFFLYRQILRDGTGQLGGIAKIQKSSSSNHPIVRTMEHASADLDRLIVTMDLAYSEAASRIGISREVLVQAVNGQFTRGDTASTVDSWTTKLRDSEGPKPEVKIITALGRNFEVSVNGKLLNLEGRETRYSVMDLEIHMESRKAIGVFDPEIIKEGDHVAEWGINPGSGGHKAAPAVYLLIRGGRLVSERDTLAIIFD